MKLEHYKPLGHNIVVEPIIQNELKQGSLYIPNIHRDNSVVLAKVLKVGPLCEGVSEGQVVVLDNVAHAREILFENHIGQAYSINQHIVLGVFNE